MSDQPLDLTPETIAAADAADLARIASQATDAQLQEALSEPETRQRILDEIFRRMADHVEPDQIKNLDNIVHFKIASGDDESLYEVAFKDGSVAVSDSATTESPAVAITTDPVNFLKLATGQESGPTLFMGGKLKLEGDMVFATQLTSFFHIPAAA